MANEHERRKPLRDWLLKHGAVALWRASVNRIDVEAHQVRGGQSVLVVLYLDGGWDLWVPASRENKIDATLAAAEKALGL